MRWFGGGGLTGTWGRVFPDTSGGIEIFRISFSSAFVFPIEVCTGPWLGTGVGVVTGTDD